MWKREKNVCFLSHGLCAHTRLYRENTCIVISNCYIDSMLRLTLGATCEWVRRKN